MLSREQEMELLEHDIRDAQRRLRTLERAPHEGRWALGGIEWMDAVANANMRIARLELDLVNLRLAEVLEEELA